jgi:hypothetical protein
VYLQGYKQINVAFMEILSTVGFTICSGASALLWLDVIFDITGSAIRNIVQPHGRVEMDGQVLDVEVKACWVSCSSSPAGNPRMIYTTDLGRVMIHKFSTREIDTFFKQKPTQDPTFPFQLVNTLSPVTRTGFLIGNLKKSHGEDAQWTLEPNLFGYRNVYSVPWKRAVQTELHDCRVRLFVHAMTWTGVSLLLGIPAGLYGK